MIKINLAKKRLEATAGAGATQAESLKSKINFDALKGMGAGSGKALGPLLLQFGIPLGVAFGANYFLEDYFQGRRDEQAKELAAVSEAKDKINKQLAKIKGYEAIKIDLERNATVIRAKIDTIESLVKGRDFTAKTMMSLVHSLPKDAWIQEVAQSDKTYSIKGGATEFSMVSDFMARLQRTIYFKDVQLRSSTSDQSKKQISFELTARRD
jgi:Tfp pilus assembly protein PilN